VSPVYQEKKKPTRKFQHWGLLAGGIIIVCILAIVTIVAGVSLFSSEPTKSVPETAPQPETSQDSGVQPVQATYTAYPTNTPYATQTPETEKKSPEKCKGADWMPQPQIEPGIIVEVCTKSDRIILRENHYDSSTEIIRIYPEAELLVISGPYCADASWWWEISAPAGTKYAMGEGSYSSFDYLDDEVKGYIREGSDAVDRYYICP
jgi:hypothetical protein